MGKLAEGKRPRTWDYGLRSLLPRSLRARLTAWHLSVLGATMVLFSCVLYSLLARDLYSQVDQSLVERATQVRRVLDHGDRFQGGTEDAIDIPPPDTFAFADTLVQITDSGGKVLGSSDALHGRALPTTTTEHGPRFSTVAVGGERLRVYSTPIVLDGGVSLVVQVGRSLSEVEATLRAVRLLAMSCVGILTCVSWLVVSAMAGSMLRPLAQLADTAQAVASSGDLSKRVQLSSRHDEVGRLARTFNLMLARLQESDAHLRELLASQRRFVADASHELRTPLTSIRGNTAMLRQVPQMSEEDRTAALEEIYDEAERMSRLVNDLLTLARADSGISLRRQLVALPQLVGAVVAQVARLAGDKSVSIEGLAPIQVRGDPDALRQLLLILLDNALKYTPAGGRITVGLEAGGDAAVLKVADTGMGIPPEHLPHIFERFYRVDPARSGGGSGLGLAIARWLAEAHGGGIQVESAPGRGSTFTVRLPRGAGERSAEPELPSATLGARRGVAIDRP